MAWQPDKNNSNGSGNGQDNVYKLPPRRPQPQKDWPISPSFLGLAAAFLIVGGIMLTMPNLARGAVFPFVLAGFLISVCLHEFGHAYTAHRFGDYTIEEKGYLTLDPIKYVDPINSILFPVLIMALGGLGLPGASVYVQKHLFREKWQMSACSAAGPLFNLLTLIAIMAVLSIFSGPLASAPILRYSLAFLAMLQISMILFNLLPVPGFDGWGIIEPYLPMEIREAGIRYGTLAMFGLIFLFMFFPPIRSAFNGLMFGMMDQVGLNAADAFRGFRLFQFWQ
jgi:Zn-dependent protease